MGVCIQQWENFTCDCSMTSYTGTHCNDRECCLINALSTLTIPNAKAGLLVAGSGKKAYGIIVRYTLWLQRENSAQAIILVFRLETKVKFSSFSHFKWSNLGHPICCVP